VFYLNLNDCNISNLSKILFLLKEFKKLTHLYIGKNNLNDISSLIDFVALEDLYLHSNHIENIATITKLKSLKKLVLSFNNICSVQDINHLENLKILKLNNNKLTDISHLSGMVNLEDISLQKNQIENIQIFEKLTTLKKIDLSFNNIQDVRALCSLKNTKELILVGNKINNILPLLQLENLEILDLEDNQISSLPSEIVNFKKAHNWKKGGKGIHLRGNPFENPPVYIVKQGKAAIKAWFAEQKKTKSIQNPYVKLILTGNTTVGKTSFINFLKNQTFTEGEITTHGINQTTWKPTNTNLDINIWDFGGQEYYHSTHQLFFSNNALYLLMFDKQHNKNEIITTNINYPEGVKPEELEYFDFVYWLQNIRNFSDKSRILMLQNKVDNPEDVVYLDDKYFTEYSVEKPFDTISILNEYNYYKSNNQFSYEFEKFKDKIVEKLNKVKRGEIFEYYLKAKELIEKVKDEKPIVSIAEFIEICKPAHSEIDKRIIKEETGEELEFRWELMCKYFHETGVLLYYPDSPTLKEKIFIKPTFVTDTIYKVLNYKVKQAFGRFTFNEAVQSLDNDTVLAQDIIELMSAPNFKLIFNEPEKPDCFVAPQYLDDKKPAENILFQITDGMEIGFSLEFIHFLPKFILTEFMVTYGRFNSNDIIWKYGIIFKKYGTKAFVEILFSERKIIYKSDKTGEFERLKYEVFETLRNINRNDKNLKIALDAVYFYHLETVLSHEQNPMFRLFREGYENYKKDSENNKLFELINNSFDDDMLQTFCMSYFYEVFNDFANGQTKSQRIRMLIIYCKKHFKTKELLEKIKEENPVQYGFYISNKF